MNQPTFYDRGDDVRVLTLTLRDVRDAARLLGRIAGTKANTPESVEARTVPDLSRDILVEKARTALSDRRRRVRTFGAGMFGEPGWDILLLLYIELQGQRLTIGRVADCIGAAQTTVLRWLQFLETRALIRREQHPNDARAIFVELTEKGIRLLDTYFSETSTQET